MTPLVSVIICVRNGADTLGRQLAAVEAQRSTHPFELVIVDNGSTDGTAELIRHWAAEEHDAERFPVQIVDGGSVPGIPAARNAGIRRARGRVLAFCDADDAIRDGWIQAFGDALRDREALAGGSVHPHHPGDSETGASALGVVQTPYLSHVGGACMAVTRAACDAVGGFDQTLPTYGFEDVVFSWRVQEAGFPLLSVPDAAVDFTVSGNSASIRKRFRLGQGRVLMARRFPAYDARRYTVGGTLKDAVGVSVGVLGAALRTRSVDRTEAGRVVAAWGRVYGCIVYGPLGGLLKRRLGAQSGTGS